MRICIPTVSDASLAARVCPHFGSAPFFTVVDEATGAVEVVRNTHVEHVHCSCDPAAAVLTLGIGAVVCRGVGWRGLAMLEERGVPVCRTESWSAADALKAFRARHLSRAGSEHACRHEP